MTCSVSAGWREVYSALSVPYPDDPVKTGEGADTHGFARAVMRKRPSKR